MIHILGERASLKSNHLKPIALEVKRNHKKRVERTRKRHAPCSLVHGAGSLIPCDDWNKQKNKKKPQNKQTKQTNKKWKQLRICVVTYECILHPSIQPTRFVYINSSKAHLCTVHEEANRRNKLPMGEGRYIPIRLSTLGSLMLFSFSNSF